MATYRFDNHETELVDPIIEDWEVRFNKNDVANNYINISVNLSTSDSKVRNVELTNVTVQQYVLNIANLELLIQYHMDQNHLIS